MSDLSELEACVLGLILSEAPCTPYRVQQIVKSSPSPQWSGSAGAIYPIFDRLEERGLVESETRIQGKRPSRVFRVLPAGSKALRAWIGPPLPEWTVEIPIDPLRTRLRFLGALSATSQLAVLREAREQLREKLVEVREDCEQLAAQKDLYAHAMARGAFYVMEARLQWIIEIEEAIAR
jgi:DNA-binding PadR family transcriptional regulator